MIFFQTYLTLTVGISCKLDSVMYVRYIMLKTFKCCNLFLLMIARYVFEGDPWSEELMWKSQYFNVMNQIILMSAITYIQSCFIVAHKFFFFAPCSELHPYSDSRFIHFNVNRHKKLDWFFVFYLNRIIYIFLLDTWFSKVYQQLSLYFLLYINIIN